MGDDGRISDAETCHGRNRRYPLVMVKPSEIQWDDQSLKQALHERIERTPT